MATCFNSYSFCNGIMSGKLDNFEYFLITVLFVKTKEISGKILVFIASNCWKYIAAFKSRSGRDRVDQNDIKYVFCMKNCFLGFIPLTPIPTNKEMKLSSLENQTQTVFRIYRLNSVRIILLNTLIRNIY